MIGRGSRCWEGQYLPHPSKTVLVCRCWAMASPSVFAPPSKLVMPAWNLIRFRLDQGHDGAR